MYLKLRKFVTLIIPANVCPFLTTLWLVVGCGSLVGVDDFEDRPLAAWLSGCSSAWAATAEQWVNRNLVGGRNGRGTSQKGVGGVAGVGPNCTRKGIVGIVATTNKQKTHSPAQIGIQSKVYSIYVVE